MYVELIRSFAKILDLMGKGCREDDNEKLNVKGYVNGMITANKISYL